RNSKGFLVFQKNSKQKCDTFAWLRTRYKYPKRRGNLGLTQRASEIWLTLNRAIRSLIHILQESKNGVRWVRWHIGVGVSSEDAPDLAAHRPGEAPDRASRDHNAGLPGMYTGPHRESTSGRHWGRCPERLDRHRARGQRRGFGGHGEGRLPPCRRSLD